MTRIGKFPLTRSCGYLVCAAVSVLVTIVVPSVVEVRSSRNLQSPALTDKQQSFWETVYLLRIGVQMVHLHLSHQPKSSFASCGLSSTASPSRVGTLRPRGCPSGAQSCGESPIDACGPGLLWTMSARWVLAGCCRRALTPCRLFLGGDRC